MFLYRKHRGPTDMIGSRNFERLISYGILGAIYGAGAMTLVRLGLYRTGLID